MRKFIIAISILLCFVSSWAWAFSPSEIAELTASAPAAPTFTGLLYVDFNDEISDAQIDATPTGWNDDYTTLVLEGAQSAFAEGNDAADEARVAKWQFGPQASGTTYYRVAFRIASYALSDLDFAFGVYLYNASAVSVLDGFLRIDADTTNRISVKGKATSTTTIDPADTTLFGAGTYYLFITYIPATSITLSIMDSNFAAVSGWSTSMAITQTDQPAEIGLYLFRRGVDVIWDTLEARSDTNWGN